MVENHSYSVQQQFSVADSWFVARGARVDDNAHYGAAINPKLSGGGYRLPFREGALSSVKVSANVGRARHQEPERLGALRLAMGRR